MNESMMNKEVGVICNELLGNVSEGKSKTYTSDKPDVENLNRTMKYEYQDNVDAGKWRLV